MQYVNAIAPVLISVLSAVGSITACIRTCKSLAKNHDENLKVDNKSLREENKALRAQNRAILVQQDEIMKRLDELSKKPNTVNYVINKD